MHRRPFTRSLKTMKSSQKSEGDLLWLPCILKKFKRRNYASNKSAWINGKNLTSDSMWLKFESGKKLSPYVSLQGKETLLILIDVAGFSRR